MIELLLAADGNIRRAEIHWDCKGHEAHGGLSSTILGRIIIDGDHLTAEVNSAKRAKSIHRRIEARAGTGARFKLEEIGSLERMMRDEALMGRVMANPSEHEALMQAPEHRPRMADTIRAHWGAWVDRDLPALGGRTPREVVGIEVLPARVRVIDSRSTPHFISRAYLCPPD